jgi:hypothetical protein
MVKVELAMNALSGNRLSKYHNKFIKVMIEVLTGGL